MRNKKCILCWVAFVACLFSCGSDKPDYLEPHLTTLSATDITRTDATLNGSVAIEGETEMPQLQFRYGTTKAMEQTVSAAIGDNSTATARIIGLTPATTYYYMIEGTNGRTTVTSNMMSFTTQPNEKPTLGTASIISHGPMSVIVGYDITNDGGETITETGCLYALVTAADEKKRVAISDTKMGIGKQTVLLSELSRNTAYLIWPYAVSRMGETVGESITFTTGDAVSLGDAGQLRALLGKELYGYLKLSVAGSLNGDDLRCLREMMGRGLNNTTTSGRLADLNLTDAKIVSGGEPYDGSRYAADDTVGQGVFADCQSMKRIALPVGITTIEKDAFARCTNLEDIEIPAATTSVLPSTGCTALQSISVSGANTSYISKDGVLPIGSHTDCVAPDGQKW